MITGSEALRLSLLPEPASLALAAGDDEPYQAAQAAATLGLEPHAEHEAEPACDWCGRSNPPGGLEDQSLNGPASYECRNGPDCQSARARQLPMWMDKQYHWWKIDWDKYNRMLAYQAEQAARTRFGGGIYSLAAEANPEFLLALAEVRQLVEAKAVGQAEDMRELLELTAARQMPGLPDPATPQAPAAPIKVDPFGHTLRNPANRTHLLGHHRQHRGVIDAAGALARKAVQDRHES